MSTRSLIMIAALGGCGLSVDDGLNGAPATCRDLRNAGAGDADGDYTLYVDRDPERPWEAYCAAMDSDPVEYLPLRATDERANRSRLESFHRGALTAVTTRYDMVRIDPRNLAVDIGDRTFASSEGAAITPAGVEVTAVAFGVAGACTDDAFYVTAGSATVDLVGTGFIVDSGFCHRDGRADLNGTAYSYGRSRVDVDVFPAGSDACASASPEPCLAVPFDETGGFHLRLAYAP